MTPAAMPRVYRGASLEDLLPQIREELGEDAIITCQREGIVGGIGGFFGRRCVEVEVVAAEWLGLDEPSAAVPVGLAAQAYAQPDEDALTADVGSNPVIRRLIEQSTPFAEHLKDALDEVELPDEPTAGQPDGDVPIADEIVEARPPIEPVPPLSAERAPLPPAERAPLPARVQHALVAFSEEDASPLTDPAAAALVEAGLAEAVARAAVEEVERHVRPFAPHEAFTTQLRRVLARRIPVAHGFIGNRRTIALAGPAGSGRTLAAVRIARAYASVDGFDVAVIDLTGSGSSGPLHRLLEGTGIEIRPATTPDEAARVTSELTRRGRILVVDTPPVLGDGPRRTLRPAELLAAVRPDELHVVLPASMEDGLAAFVLEAVGTDSSRDRLLLTRLDESERIGGVLGLAIERRIPISYVSRGSQPERGLQPADPVTLASMLLR